MLTTLITAALAFALSFGAIAPHHGSVGGPPVATTYDGGDTISGGGPPGQIHH